MSDDTLSIDVPEWADEDSYLAGAKAAFHLVAGSSMRFVEAIDTPDETPSPEVSGGGGEDADTCSCGLPLVQEMGRQGKFCRECDN